ncbi:centrosomal protein of 95 kDa-like isoform X1 [Asterias rubens]|uniref:centrosomal protein of 95 kDa-like isoform X1 n=1 Tax=Asterias rubens TaxID=7604 RepID=UPI001455770D|nr:centrosomal protein of 95 kDa-like isoform X1 [Asterias rubens]
MSRDYATNYSMGSDTSKDDTAIANELLKRVNLPPVNDLSECTSSIFVALCEGILGDPLQGISYVPITKEDEIHNVQLVVDHLGDKVLHCDLSHIDGRAVVEGDRVAMQYLLEILLGVMDYIMGGIDSEGSATDFEDGDLVDPDTMTRGTVSAITDVLREEFGHRGGKDNYYGPPSNAYERPYESHTISDISKHLSQPNSQSEGDSTAELIKLGTKDASSRDVPQRDIPQRDFPQRDIQTSGAISVRDSSRDMPDVQPSKRIGYIPDSDDRPRKTLPSSPTASGVVDSTTRSPSRQKEDLTLQDLSGSSFSSVSWPKPPPTTHVVSDHQPLNEFDSLGLRPRPAFTKDRPASDAYGATDSLLGSLREGSRQHHIHTHHHYHPPVGSKPSTSTGPPKSPPHATLSRPPVSGGTSSAGSSPSTGIGEREEYRGSVWRERLAARDTDLPTSSDYRPRQRYPATLHSTYPAPAQRRPTSSASLRGGTSSRQQSHPPSRQQGNVFMDDAEEVWRRSASRREEEPILPPRPRRVAFEDDIRDSSHRSFFREILGPYTSHDRHESSDSEQDSDIDVLSQCSDSAVDYQRLGTSYPTSPIHDDRKYLPPRSTTRDQPIREPSSKQYDLRPRSQRSKTATQRRHPPQRPKSVLLPVPSSRSHRVRFEEALEADATGPMGRIRKKLNKENRKQSRQKEVLRYVYESNLQEAKSGLKKQINRNKSVLDKQDAEYKKVFSGPKTSKYQPATKYNTKVTTDRLSRSRSKAPSSKRKRSASSSPTMHRHKRLSIGEDEMLPTVMQEFPFLHVSPQTAHDMWAKQMRQMEQLTKMGIDQQYKKTKTQLKMEEAEKRQDVLLRIMKKELGHNQRMREIKETQAKDRAVQTKVQEQRQVNARARRYYEEFRLRSKSRMMKRKTREEQIFKRLFEDGLKIQKARIHDLRNYAREKREESSRRQQDEIDSLENYYRNQFSMLAEAIATERYELQVRDTAQTKVMERMKRDMRRKMEQEIRDVQEQMYQDEDTEYFRQLEADRLRGDLQVASYKTMI